MRRDDETGRDGDGGDGETDEDEAKAKAKETVRGAELSRHVMERCCWPAAARISGAIRGGGWAGRSALEH